MAPKPNLLFPFTLQTGDRRSPSSIEVIAIERITIERPSRLHTVACALARTLRLPVSWQGAVAAADSEDARSASLMDSLAGGVTGPAGTAARGHAALGAAASAAARRQAALAAFGEDGVADEQVLPMGAFDDEYRDDVDEMEQPGRRLMLEAQEVGCPAFGGRWVFCEGTGRQGQHQTGWALGALVGMVQEHHTGYHSTGQVEACNAMGLWAACRRRGLK